MVTALFNKVFKRKPAAEAAQSDVDKMLQSVVERRVNPRYAVRQLTGLYVTQRPLSTVIVDISMSGARFATRLPREVGVVVGIDIEANGMVMRLPLRILWDKWAGGCFENGGVFVDLTPEETAHLRRYVAWASENPPDENDPTEIADMLVAKAMESLPQLAEI